MAIDFLDNHFNCWPQTNNLVLQNQIAKPVRSEILVVYCSNYRVANQQRKERGWNIMSVGKNDVFFFNPF
jgi:hypothetical protein